MKNPRAIVQKLKRLGSRRNVEGMARFGIRGRNILGVPKPALDRLARSLGKDHALALGLWATGVHEARILAALVDDPAKTTSGQMEKWVKDFDSWDLCDACCGHLFDRTPFAVRKVFSWSRRKGEYQKRAGFVLMAWLAVHDQHAPDRLFLSFLPVIRREAGDGRNFVKKAANWALRQIGKRNRRLNRAAIREARYLVKLPFPSARWIASDALRELTHPRTPVRDLPRKSV
jgi:3-methyladenine DNA glycosylase AlkD